MSHKPSGNVRYNVKVDSQYQFLTSSHLTDFEVCQFIEFNSTRNMHAVKVTDSKITFNHSLLVRNKTKLQILARHNKIFKGNYFSQALNHMKCLKK